MLTQSKRAGVPFDVAWKTAWRRISWPHDTAHRQQWKAMLGDRRAAVREKLELVDIEANVQAWREAYEDAEVPRYVLACLNLEVILDRDEELIAA